MLSPLPYLVLAKEWDELYVELLITAKTIRQVITPSAVKAY